MFDEQERNKMRTAAVLLGEPACSELRRVLTELDAAEERAGQAEREHQDCGIAIAALSRCVRQANFIHHASVSGAYQSVGWHSI